ncbi:hypothetical protein [Sphingomonas baiyangensis]|uniref:Uncharacterized protein n=1 Tax=Sphingomonas baiyangensis TaxID=2572576 RepID=A0A4U1L3J8_9SPHN|nr:hypothetical protein [Sphingomonas baiyangensis]TKD50773.1 hypothetical protein FBR43_08325 [Sphingomonas baiyangensis]
MGLLLVSLLFAAALALAVAVIYLTVAPEYARIRSLLVDGVTPAALVAVPVRRRVRVSPPRRTLARALREAA